MKITLLTGKTFDYAKEVGFDLKIVSSPKAKKLTLRIDEKNKIPVVCVPKFCPRKTVLKFLEKHKDWVFNSLARLPKTVFFFSGDEIVFLGEKIVLLHEPEQKGIVFEKNCLKTGGQIEFFHRRVKDFLKEKTLQYLKSLTREKAKILGCKVKNVAIKDTKSRWGSCSSLGNINYNWRICFAPKEVIEYLVCHEVAHLKEANHSKNFWELVEKLCPDCVEARRWLKKFGKNLYKYA